MRRIVCTATLVLGVLLVGTSLAADGACLDACRTARKGCLARAKAERTAMKADCRDLGGHVSCLTSAVAHTKNLVKDCRSAVSTCRACCDGGGAPQKCSTNCDGESYNSTWEGIQKHIFAQHDCAQQACHSSGAKQGGLDLSPDVAYKNLLTASAGSPFQRVEPGDERRSFLWLKLAAATDPSAVPSDVTVGTPMPNGLPALSIDELEVVRKWIYAGAPETGTVNGTQDLLGACLPPASPLHIKRLPPPPAGQGFQLTMPPFLLEQHSEHEYCAATYYDISAQVPKEFQDAAGKSFIFNQQELRQDPQSHHLILNLSATSVDQIHDPSFGDWTCRGGKKTGLPCEPTDLTSCGKKGICTAQMKSTFACIGYGPSSRGGLAIPFAIGGAQRAQAFTRFYPGVYAAIPMKGILYWNPHAFNLTDIDTVMHGWINYWFAKERLHFARFVFNIGRIFAPSAAPFTKQDVCNDQVLPRGARLFALSSHTHRHGERFWVTTPDGKTVYENFVYNDPPNKPFEPPLEFDSEDPAQRTLHYCATYNNGLRSDGSFDTEFVTRASRVPPGAPAFSHCTPSACVAGNVGAPCNGSSANASCDSTAGAGDGVCDACRITGGESTENEMFILIGQYFVQSLTN